MTSPIVWAFSSPINSDDVRVNSRSNDTAKRIDRPNSGWPERAGHILMCNPHAIMLFSIRNLIYAFNGTG